MLAGDCLPYPALWLTPPMVDKHFHRFASPVFDLHDLVSSNFAGHAFDRLDSIVVEPRVTIRRIFSHKEQPCASLACLSDCLCLCMGDYPLFANRIPPAIISPTRSFRPVLNRRRHLGRRRGAGDLYRHRRCCGNQEGARLWAASRGCDPGAVIRGKNGEGVGMRRLLG